MSTTIKKIQKRNGTIVPFDRNRISNAIYKAMFATKEGSKDEAIHITQLVEQELVAIRHRHKNFIPTVEGVQDMVEMALMANNYTKTAKAYILYREQRAALRRQKHSIPEHVKKLAEQSSKYFRNPLSEFIYLRTYARWIEEENRRETWIETVDRYMAFMRENLGTKLSPPEYQEIREAILTQQVMPSMRLLQFAGQAVRATNVCAYNCSYIAPKTIDDFGEVMYLSMCGTGVGFSVENQNVQALPQINIQTGKALPVHVVADSKEGWCDALVLGIKTWFNGQDINFDFTKCRPAGTRLKTMGGKSSGPEPLRALLEFTRNKILRRQGRRLTSLDVHDILCKIGEIVVSGGVRRSAMISLSDLDDGAIRDAKKGQFYLTEPQRMMANNSAVYLAKPSNEEFMEEWLALIRSGSGERGIFNRGSLIKTLPKRRKEVWQEDNIIMLDKVASLIGTNPCGEIILRSKQFCNLAEIIARTDDDEASLLNKMRIATIIGTYQATLTNFPYLAKEWQINCERERLLGISITGQWDCPKVRSPQILTKLKDHAIFINESYAKRFNINAATAITCVKPSGTVSQLVDCASGMHPRHAPYYIRRVRISATDTLFKMLKEQGIPYHPEVGQTETDATTFVIDFPVAAPESKVYRDNLSAIAQLEFWKMLKAHYTEHNPSITISVGTDEWLEVANWVYNNWDIIGGLSFLPRFEHVYQLAPYEEITEQQYHELKARFADVNFAELASYEHGDETNLKQELACVGGACELN